MPLPPNKPLRFGWAKLDALLGDGLEDLTIQNFEEVEPHKDHIPLAIDWGHLRDLERVGTYRVVAAYRGKCLVGYDSFFLNRHTRHMHTVFAMGDVIWLLPEERRGWTGVRFIRASDALLVEAGATLIRRGCQRGVRDGALADIFLRLGYRHVEDQFDKIMR